MMNHFRDITKKVLVCAMLLAGQAWGDTIDVIAASANRIQSGDAVYATARNATTGTVQESYLQVGQTNSYVVIRAFLFFNIPAYDEITGATLFLNGQTDNSSADFDVYVVSAAALVDSAMVGADFNDFDGWQASGEYNGAVLNNTWNSSSFSANWNELSFTAAGVDSVNAHSGGSWVVVLVSRKDYEATTPTGLEVVSFDTITDIGTEPFLRITYTSGWEGTVSGVSNPATVWGVDKAEIQSVWGVE